jgi:hypothetical protein
LDKIAQTLRVEIHPKHNIFSVNERTDITIAEMLTTLSAYLVLFLQKEAVIEEPEKLAPKLILNGYIRENDIHIEMPSQMENGGIQMWKIPMTKEGINKFFLEKMHPPLGH